MMIISFGGTIFVLENTNQLESGSAKQYPADHVGRDDFGFVGTMNVQCKEPALNHNVDVSLHAYTDIHMYVSAHVLLYIYIPNLNDGGS